MLRILTETSTWLMVELVATVILILMNLLIPLLMSFNRYRTIGNFYFSSVALSSSLLNCLYMYYLVQTFQTKTLSENNCRAIYYLQTSCIVVLAYTIIAMHANFVLCLFPTDAVKSPDQTCFQCLGACLRRFFRRFCFCVVLCIWSLSFTATIPLLYSLDSNEKSPKPVYCPGTTQISYLEEWFDRNRIVQTILFNLIPSLISLFLSFIALLKLFLDFSYYIFLRMKRSKCFSCCKRSRSSRPNLIPMATIQMNPYLQTNNIEDIIRTPSSETTEESIEPPLESCGQFCSNSFQRFLLVVSCCLIACIYPIAMRFYMIYFSVFVPLFFAVMNYSSGSSLSSDEKLFLTIEDHSTATLRPSTEINPNNRFPSIETPTVEHQRKHSITPTDPHELRSPLILNRTNDNDDEQRNSMANNVDRKRSIDVSKQKYFSNHLYENTRNFLRR